MLKKIQIVKKGVIHWVLDKFYNSNVTTFYKYYNTQAAEEHHTDYFSKTYGQTIDTFYNKGPPTASKSNLIY